MQLIFFTNYYLQMYEHLQLNTDCILNFLLNPLNLAPAYWGNNKTLGCVDHAVLNQLDISADNVDLWINFITTVRKQS